MKKVYTTGVFDIMHRGHLNILTQAAALGDLIVGIQSDKWVEKLKGRPPVLSLEERVAQLKSLPFVSSVLVYGDPDQIPLYESIKPEIIVQGDDWLHSGDRSKALEYLRDHNIRLVLLPRTEGISTTEIRKRIAYATRKDETFLLTHLRMVKIEDLKLYEQYDEEKVLRLMEKISGDGFFSNPISVVEEMIVIDGVNRLEAGRRLGFQMIPCLVFPYDEIDLVGNVHFIKNGKKTRLSEFAAEEGKRIEFPARTPQEIRDCVAAGKMIPNGETWHRVPQSVVRLPIPLVMLFDREIIERGEWSLEAFIKEKIASGMIRFYPSNVYVCDEW